MSTRAESSGYPPLSWWLVLITVLAVGFLGNWYAAGALLVFILLQWAWPLDFLVSFLIVCGGAAFIFNEGGNMTLQLAMLSVAAAVMIVCYFVTMRDRAFSVWNSPLTWPVLAFFLMSMGNTVRGFMIGNDRRNLGLELAAILGLCSALLVANAFDTRRYLRAATIGIILVAVGPSIKAFHTFMLMYGHTSGVYSLAVPGIVAVMLVNMSLRAKTTSGSLGLAALSLPFFFEQFISYGRGVWTGDAAGLVASILMYALGRDSGSKERWRRVGGTMAFMLIVGVFASIQAALLLGKADVLLEAGTRVSSITSTSTGYESRSNLIRLVEYGVVLRLLLRSPFFGYGLGYTFLVKEVFTNKTAPQWGVHENYLLVWLKQGLIGLVLFVWMLWTAITVGIRQSRRRTDFWESSWFASTATTTIILAVFSLSNYPFGVVNEMFLLALFLGGAMAMTGKDRITLRWNASRKPGESA